MTYTKQSPKCQSANINITFSRWRKWHTYTLENLSYLHQQPLPKIKCSHILINSYMSIKKSFFSRKMHNTTVGSRSVCRSRSVYWWVCLFSQSVITVVCGTYHMPFFGVTIVRVRWAIVVANVVENCQLM